MNKETFIAACEAAYGESWTTPISQALGVSDRTVRHWRNGKYALPEGITADMINILEARKKDIDSAIKLINAQN